MGIDLVWWVWLIFAGIFLVIEMFSLTFAFLVFAIGAIFASILSYLNISVPWQLISFAVISLILFVIVRKHPNFLTSKNGENVGPNRLKDKVALVTEEIDNINNKGFIEVAGEKWRAVSVNGDIIEANSKVIVKSISGVKANVVKLEK